MRLENDSRADRKVSEIGPFVAAEATKRNIPTRRGDDNSTSWTNRSERFNVAFSWSSSFRVPLRGQANEKVLW